MTEELLTLIPGVVAVVVALDAYVSIMLRREINGLRDDLQWLQGKVGDGVPEEAIPEWGTRERRDYHVRLRNHHGDLAEQAWRAIPKRQAE